MKYSFGDICGVPAKFAAQRNSFPNDMIDPISAPQKTRKIWYKYDSE